MLKAVFISNIPSPYQVEWAKKLNGNFDVQFWFLTDIKNSTSKRPSYWNVDLPEYCRVLDSKLKFGELCYCPSIEDELDKFNPDIVNIGGAWFMIGAYQAYRWAVRNNKKIITMPLEFSNKMLSWKSILRNKLIYNFIYSKCDLFLANGYIHYDYLTLALGKSNVRLFSNYDQYAPYLKHPVRKRKDTITFMYGGAMDRRMRVPELIDVFEGVAKKYSNVRLIIGGYGPEKLECQKKVSSSSYLVNKVYFKDVQSWGEIVDVYEEADVLINYASFSPGAGVILSAVASGMGVIAASQIHASRQFIIDGYNGILVYDALGLYKAMESYILHPSKLLEHSARNKLIGGECLSMEFHLRHYSTVIDELVF